MYFRPCLAVAVVLLFPVFSFLLFSLSSAPCPFSPCSKPCASRHQILFTPVQAFCSFCSHAPAIHRFPLLPLSPIHTHAPVRSAACRGFPRFHSAHHNNKLSAHVGYWLNLLLVRGVLSCGSAAALGTPRWPATGSQTGSGSISAGSKGRFQCRCHFPKRAFFRRGVT